MRAFTLQTTRFTISLLRTLRYILDLMLWSRLFVVQRTADNINVQSKSLDHKKVVWAQPELVVTGREGGNHFAQGFNIVYGILLENLRAPNHLVTRRHALPGPAFAGVYLWDSAFIALIWQHWDQTVAWDVLASVVELRDSHRLQHVAADFTRSEYTQPPLIAWAASRILKQTRTQVAPSDNPELLNMFNILSNFNNWLNTNRRLENGLYFWAHPYESGVENAPRFSSTDEKTLSNTRNLAAPDLCTYMVLQCEALQQMATTLQKEEAAQYFAQEVVRIKDLTNNILWDANHQLYFDYDVEKQAFIQSRTIASLLPLAAGIPDAARAEQLKQWAVSATGFGSLIPFPSVALDDKDFEKDMWRGPVWVNTAYLVLDGLKRYGYEDDYRALAWRLCDGVYRVLENENQVYEFYDPEYYHTRELNRKKGNLFKALTLGTGPQKDFVGWSGLVNTLVVECFFGYQKIPGGMEVRPRFPSEAAGLTFELNLPQDQILSMIEVRDEGRYQVNMTEARPNGNVQHVVEVSFGESVVLKQGKLCRH